MEAMVRNEPTDTLSQEKDYTEVLSVRHVLVVLTGILVCFAPCTLVFNTWSLMMVPVCNELGSTHAQFSLFVTAVFLSSAVFAPFAGNFMEKFDLRIVITVSCLLCGLGIFLCSTWTEIWQFYISGVIEGFGVVVLMYLTAPTLINRWFNSHTGLLVGLCVAMTGVGGALWSMVGGMVISGEGWRAAYQVFAAAAVLIAVPAALFFIRSYPEEVGLKPYGAPPTNDNVDDAVSREGRSISAARVFRSPVFYLLMITIGLFNGTAQLGNLLPTYIYHLGDMGLAGITPQGAIMMASVIATCLMISQAVSKVGLGTIADKSILAALTLACVGGMLGVLFCWLGVQWTFVVYTGSVFFGMFFAATNVLGPSITLTLFGPRDHTLIYSRIAAFINVTPAIAAAVFSALSDSSWDLTFTVVISLVVVTYVLAMATVFMGKRLRQGEEA